jgi:O-antigen/teichoic acid export membrane protein
MAMATFFFNIVLGPSWSAFTEAHALNDINWIKKTIARLVKIWLILLLCLFIMICISQPFYKFWIGGNISIPKSLTILMAVYVAQLCWNSIFSNYIGGVSKVRILVLLAIFNSLLNIPLAIFFAEGMGMGINGVALASIVCVSFGSIITPIQAYLLIRGKAKGIWNK